MKNFIKYFINLLFLNIFLLLPIIIIYNSRIANNIQELRRLDYNKQKNNTWLFAW